MFWKSPAMEAERCSRQCCVVWQEVKPARQRTTSIAKPSDGEREIIMNIQNEALVRGDRRAVKTILAIALLGLTMSQASAQTTNSFLNGLIDRANGEVRGAQQDMAAIEGKTQDLRYACWNGDDRACNGLRRILAQPKSRYHGQPGAATYRCVLAVRSLGAATSVRPMVNAMKV